MRKKTYILLFIITLFIGIFLRFYELGKVPSSLNWDEVSWGYNAYSILKTGHDEHGVFMPMSFEAFGDYKQPIYVYLTSVSVAFFGLNSFAVRLPSALLGTLTIISVFFLVLNLFCNEKNKHKLALFSMLIFAVSPWSIQFSRVAYEANIAVFFVISGVALFLYGVNTKKNMAAFSGIILMAISCYSYHSNKIFTPLLFISLLIFSRISRKVSKKTILLFFMLFVVANLLWIFDARTTARGRSVTFISNQTPILKSSVEAIEFDKSSKDFVGALLHNRRIVYSEYYLENYLSHFDLNFLFIKGDNARHHAFGMGVLYLTMLPLIALGLLFLDKKKYWILLVWFLLAPVASALAIDAPNASRSLAFLPTWQIFGALGGLLIFELRKKRTYRYLLYALFVIIFINFVYFTHNYFYHTNSEYGIYWQDGYKEVVLEAKKLSDSGKKVVISSKFEQPYIFYLFYNNYNPIEYIDSQKKWNNRKCIMIDHVYFGICDDRLSKGFLYISNDKESSPKLEEVGEIRSGERVVGRVYEYL